jgi:hypothetical protein
MVTFAELFERHAVASLDKQLALADLIGDADWWIDLAAGMITFGDQYTFPIQVLGTEAEAGRTWLWAWANAASAIPPPLLACATRLQTLGQAEAIAELTAPEIPLDQIDGHRLALVASGVCNADGYYRGPYDGGAVFVLVQVPQVREQAPPSAMRFVNTFTQFIATFPANHRRALMAYAEYKAGSYTPTAAGLTVQLPGGETIEATFDTLDRLTNIATRLSRK